MDTNIVDVKEVRTKETIITEIKTTVQNVQLTALQGAICIGENLKELKEIIPHGRWLEYIEESLSWNKRKVQRFIQLADSYGAEDSSYSKLIQMRQELTHLSVSSALKLLSIDEEEIEEFAEEHIEEDMTSKQLEDVIREYKEENASLSTQVANLKNDVKRAKQGSVSEEEYNKLKSKLAKATEKAKKEKEKTEQAIKEAEQVAMVAVEERVRKDVQAEIEELKKDIEKLDAERIAAENKALNSGNETLIKFKVEADNWQASFEKMNDCILHIQSEDTDKAAAMRSAVESILAGMGDKLQGVIG